MKGIERRDKWRIMKLTLGLVLVLAMSGCSTAYVRQWQSNLWKVENNVEGDIAEVGVLRQEDLSFQVLCTRFRQVNYPYNNLISLTVSCRNQSKHTQELFVNPIQVVGEQDILRKALPLDHVMYTLYGGELRDSAQRHRVALPVPDFGNSAVGNVLNTIAAVYKSYENEAIVTELHAKEGLPYHLYYNSFEPVSLPPGLSAAWTDYFPIGSSEKTIAVLLQGDTAENAVVFNRPPPPPQPPPPKRTSAEAAAIVVVFIITGFVGMVIIASED